MPAINLREIRRGLAASIVDTQRRVPGRGHQVFLESLDEAIAAKQVSLKDVSIRQLFEEFIPNGREMVASWDPRSGGTGGHSFSTVRNQMLLEETGAVTYGAFSHITGQLVFNSVLEGYKNEDFIFSQINENVPTMFNGERIPGISRIGDTAETIPEGQPYPLVGVAEDYIDTPQTLKKGLMDALTKEAVFFDRTMLVVNRCREVGEFLGLNKEKRLIDAVCDINAGATAGPNSHRYKWKGTTYASFQATTPWVNVKTGNALVDWTNVDALEQIGQKILDPFTGEPIGYETKDLIVTRQNKWVAKRINFATQVVQVTPGYSTSGAPNQTFAASPLEKNYRIISSNQLGARMTAGSEALTDWFAGDLARAVKYNENWPITVQQAPPNNIEEFTRDIVMMWKASERGAAFVKDPRYLLRSSM